jgi:hypothetical protein
VSRRDDARDVVRQTVASIRRRRRGLQQRGHPARGEL